MNPAYNIPTGPIKDSQALAAPRPVPPLKRKPDQIEPVKRALSGLQSSSGALDRTYLARLQEVGGAGRGGTLC